MEKKHNRYEKPVLEKIDLVGEGQGGACAAGPAASGECDAGSVPSGQCNAGNLPL